MSVYVVEQSNFTNRSAYERWLLANGVGSHRT